ncbi:MAG: uL15 family ribosomal protein [Patescibacteria group bacterium]
MQFNGLKGSSVNKDKKRVGRGGKRGTYSGRGIKGQRARSGRKLRPEWRDALKKIPKRRGYAFGPVNKKPRVVNLDVIAKVFKEGDLVSPMSLAQKGLVKKSQNHLPQVKILGQSKVIKKMSFQNLIFSAGAKEAIIKAGGTIK